MSQGQHATAAEQALARGLPGHAARLYEQLWDFARASAAARAAGDLPRALRCAVSARDEAAIGELVALLARDQAGQRTAADLLAQLRRHGDAAPLYEELGLADEAAQSYLRAHRDLDAARIYQQLGQDRRAGQILERALELATVDEKPSLQLALGQILSRRGAHAEAATFLQSARTSPALSRAATMELIVTLAALGLRDGARDLLLELRRAPEGPVPAALPGERGPAAAEPAHGVALPDDLAASLPDDLAADLPADLPADLDAFLRWWRDRPSSRPRSKEPDLVGGRFRLERPLGAGGSGRVFLATDEVSGRQVALKMFFAAEARGSSAFERFAREARLAQALRHPNLVEVYEVSIDLGFLVMELLHGGSLAQRLAQGERPSGPQVRRLALELIEGLSAAHQRGIIHRDLKPANVFFDSRGSAKLGDFGVAHLVDLGQTQTGGLIGTLAYMSPEQITGAPISVAADLYGLGVTLFEALTGRLPFLGPDFVAQHLGEPPPRPTDVDPLVAPGWNELLARLLAKNPAERTPSLVELRAELDHLDLGGRSAPVTAPAAQRSSAQRPAVSGASDAGPSEAAAAAASAHKEPRYRFETPLGATALSSLVRAVDSVLERSVILERFETTEDADRRMEHVRLLARAHTPFLQRALSLDRLTRTAVFEAPSGATLADARPQLSAAELSRVLKRLARGIAAIHELGGWHGAIEPRTVVVDENHVPTLLASGLGEPSAGTAAGDVQAVIGIAAHLAECAPTLAEIFRVTAARVDATPPAAPQGELTDGEALYAAADALEVAVLSALGAR